MSKVVLMKNLIIHWSNSEINSVNVLDSGPSAFPIPAVVGGVVGGVVGIMVILGVAAVVYKKCLKKGKQWWGEKDVVKLHDDHL